MKLQPLRRPEDRAAVEDLLRVASVGDDREPLSEHKHLDFLSGGSGFCWWRGEVLAGYVHAVRSSVSGTWEVETVVDPHHRDATAMRELVDATVTELGHRRLHLWAWDPELVAVLRERGYALGRRLLQLRRPLPPEIAADFPAGISVTAFRPGHDEDLWLTAHRAAFAAHPELGLWTREWLLARTNLEWFDPQGFLLARAGDEIAAYCWTKVHHNGDGEIFSIGVPPAYRGRGLGRSISLAGLWNLHDRRGVTRAMLWTDGDNAAGLAMYGALGFETAREGYCYVANAVTGR